MAKSSKSVWDRNFAEVPEIRDRFLKFVQGEVRRVRDQRKPMDSDHVRFFNMWNLQKDSSHTYNGRAKLYIPEVRKNVEAQARQLVELAFPNENFFECEPGKNGTMEGSILQKEMRRWQMRESNLRTKYHIFQRQNVMLGTSVAYVPWRKETERLMRRIRKPDGKLEVKREILELYNGPDFIPRPLRRFFLLNPFVPHLADSHALRKYGCLEFFEVTKLALEAEAKAGVLHGLKDILERKGQEVRQMEEFEHDIEMAEGMGLEIGAQGYAGEASLTKDEEAVNSRHMCTLLFVRMPFPEACEPGEDPESPIPLMIRVYDGMHVGTIMRNPFWHQAPPYVLSYYILPTEEEAYGQGLPKAIQYMQYEMNAKAEQGMDASTLALNPIAFIDPGLAAQIGDFEVAPGAQWFVNPQGVKLGSIPDTSATAYQSMGFLSGKMMEYSDRTPALPPQLQGKSRTATQSEIVERMFSVDVKSFQKTQEELALEPLMEQWESLTEQHVEEDTVIMIMGTDSAGWKRKLWSRNASLGRYRYHWMVASTLESKAILSRQLIDFGKVAGSIPPEYAGKLNMQWDLWAKMLWAEGFRLPKADEIFGVKVAKNQDPEVEGKMLKLGLEIEVLPGDDDESHIRVHDARIGELQQKKSRSADDEAELRELVAHALKHKAQAQKKAIMAEIQKRQMAMAQAAAVQQQQGGDQKGRMKGSGNRTQLSPNASAGNMASGVRA